MAPFSCFILDVDGVMTTGQFLYTAEGKAMKVFGPDDNDGLSLIKQYLEIRFVTGDKKASRFLTNALSETWGFRWILSALFVA